MKLYKNITRFQFRRFFPKGSYRYKNLCWSVSLKPGDIVGACTGFNVRIKSVEYSKRYINDWQGERRSRHNGWWIDEVKLTDTSDRWHYTPTSGGCVFPKETVDKIHAYWLDHSDDYIAAQEKNGWDQSFTKSVIAAIRAGEPIVDSDGVLLPEWGGRMNKRPAEG